MQENSDMDPDYNEEFEVQSDDGEIAASPVPVELEDPADTLRSRGVALQPVGALFLAEAYQARYKMLLYVILGIGQTIAGVGCV